MNNINKGDFSTEMNKSYLEYAISVITDRALPDVRDGFKPVHRRVLYAMHQLGLTPDKGYRKCARAVGDVLGKYHPHGDTSVYGALVRMAQDFSLRYPLVDGHGNFGSIDGDEAAAMRYTESKLSAITMEMLKDINKDTVDFVPNFDGEEQEPSVLPSRYPNLLVNGSEGIAVGMSTSIPPHNLTEVINGTIELIGNPKATIDDVMKYIKAPDFCMGGTIINPDDIKEMYATGVGKIIVRANYHIEDEKNSKLIVFTDIPYQVNKAKLCAKIESLTKEKNDILKDVIDIRDESNREGIRIVIEIKNKANEKLIISRLYSKTNLQSNYNSIFRVLVNKEPKVLSLIEIISHYIAFQKDIIKRKSNYELDRALNRIHILEALSIALTDIDLVVEIIKKSNNAIEAKTNLIEKLNIDEIQAKAILDLKLQRLTNLDTFNLKEEHTALLKEVDRLKSIINNESVLSQTLKEDLIHIRDTYGDSRRTKIEEVPVEEISISASELIQDYSTYIILTKEGYLKKLLRKSDNIKLKDGDEIVYQESSSNKSTLLVFTNKGICHKLYQHDIPECKPSELGIYLPNHLQLKNESIIGMVSTRKYVGYIIAAFNTGKVAKIDLSSYKTKTMRSKLENAINTEDELIGLYAIEKDIDMICKSSIDKILIFNTSDINSKSSKNTQGVQVLKSKNNSNMVKCIPLATLENVDGAVIAYYRGKPNSVGCYKRKTDIFSID